MAERRKLTDDELLAAVRDLLQRGRAGEWPIEALSRHMMRFEGMTLARSNLDNLAPFTPVAAEALPRVDGQLVDVCVQMVASALEFASRIEVAR